MLSPRIEMMLDDAVSNKARELFFRLFDERISFTDATTMAVMHQEHIRKIITFDPHFKGMFSAGRVRCARSSEYPGFTTDQAK